MKAIDFRVLDPEERFSEILFGLIMVLTFTGTLSITSDARQDVRDMLVGALGCNLAWGIADAVTYLLGAYASRGRGIFLAGRIRDSKNPAEARGILASVLPDRLVALLGDPELEMLRRKVAASPAVVEKARFALRDFVGAGSVFLLVFLSTFPVAIPFLVMSDPYRAMRWSNAVALVMLFLLGRALGRYTGGSGWRLGFGMLVLGAVLVAVIIALGG